MWNSNSVVSWLIAAAGLPTDDLRPPPGGRAPGWDAGLALAKASGDRAGHEELGVVAGAHGGTGVAQRAEALG